MFTTLAGRMFGGIDSPRYQVINKTDVYEERKYEAGQWMTTTVTGKKFKDSSNEGFMKLLKYISGTNETGKSIPMTIPVCIFCQPADDEWGSMKQEYHVGFFIPAKHIKTLPKPKDGTLTLRDSPEATMFVRRFSGFAGNKDIIEELNKLRAAVSKEQYREGCFYFCGYDSPMKLINRRNEIWLVKA